MGRRTLKANIKAFVATVPGVKTAYDYAPKRIPDQAMPAVIISLPDEDESRATMTAPVGRKKKATVVRLTIIDIGTSSNSASDEAKFDDVLDAIDEAIRLRPDLDGSVRAAAVTFLRTSVAEPRLAGKDEGNMVRVATKEFDVIEHVVG